MAIIPLALILRGVLSVFAMLDLPEMKPLAVSISYNMYITNTVLIGIYFFFIYLWA